MLNKLKMTCTFHFLKYFGRPFTDIYKYLDLFISFTSRQSENSIVLTCDYPSSFHPSFQPRYFSLFPFVSSVGKGSWEKKEGGRTMSASVRAQNLI